MKKWKVVFAIGFCLAAIACSEDPEKAAARKAAEVSKKYENEARKAVIANLKDPDSAKFGEFVWEKAADGTNIGCLIVNAKNSLGGYVGDKPAALKEENGKWILISFLDFPAMFCMSTLKEIHKKRK